MFTIYKIENFINGKKYIGYTQRYKSRVSQHLSGLRNNRHEVHTLQEDFNTFGIAAFSFSVLTTTTNVSDAKKTEHAFILQLGTLNHELGYNKSTCKGWGPESKFRDTERKLLKSRRRPYLLLPGTDLNHPVHECLIRSFKPN